MQRGSAKSYRVFVRDWWRRTEAGMRTPYPGAPKRTLARRMTYEEAQKMCQEYNATHEAGWRSRKAEFEEE
jgi:hypothetical protein